MELSTEIAARGGNFSLAGRFDAEYRAVVDAFIENFKTEDEVGAACSVMIGGRSVVDIWGGWRNAGMTVPWDAPTTVCMMSVAKGITAICFNMLIDRGLVDPDALVIDYWPEYGQNGKEATRVRHFLDHTAAVPVLTTDPLWPGAMFDREAMVRALEVQEPLWEIGTKAAYHVHHQGFLLGEIMRRVDGRTVGPFLREEVAGPLNAEYYIGGMSSIEQSVVAEVMPNMEAKLFAAKDGQDQSSLRALAFKQNPSEPWAVTMNKPQWRTVEVASGSGHGNARGVARIYGALGNGGELDGVHLMSAEFKSRRCLRNSTIRPKRCRIVPIIRHWGYCETRLRLCTWVRTCAALATTALADQLDFVIRMPGPGFPMRAIRCMPWEPMARARQGSLTHCIPVRCDQAQAAVPPSTLSTSPLMY